MFSLIASFLTAGIAVLCVFLGLFFLTSPRDMLIIRYQNFRLNSTGRPLKDEDFPRVGRLVSSLKVGGVFLILLGFTVLVYAFSAF